MASSSSLVVGSLDKRSKIIPCLPGRPMRWFFTDEKLKTENPSVKTGIDLDKELFSRQQAASFIHDLGTRLQIQHWIMNVAIVYMHRFYVFHSFKRFYKNDLAAAALFLAAKTCEMPRKLEHIVKVSYALQHREEPSLDTMSDKYVDEVQKVAMYENVLLLTLGFDLQVEVPNTFVVKLTQDMSAPKSLGVAAFLFSTDSLHLTTLCLRYRPSVIACACIYLACEWGKWEMREKRDGKPWYNQIDPEVSPELLKALSDELVDVFHKCPERLRSKRHLASVKRDVSGCIIPSSVMVDRNNGMTFDEMHDSVSAAASQFPSTSSTLPIIPLPPITTANVRIGISSASEKLLSAQSSGDGGKVTSVQVNSITSVIVSSNGAGSSTNDSPKKSRPETSKMDLSSYKARMKERELERTKTVTDGGGGQQAPLRKSFIPDMSSTDKDSWLFPSNLPEDQLKDQADLIAKEMSIPSVGGHREASSKNEPSREHRDSTSVNRYQNRHARHDDQRSRGRQQQDEKRHRHEEKSRDRQQQDEKTKSSANELTISLDQKRQQRDESSSKDETSSSSRHRSQRNHREPPKPPNDLIAGSESQETPTLKADRHGFDDKGISDSTASSSSKKRPLDDFKMTNGSSGPPVEKAARIIDYGHGGNTMSDGKRGPAANTIDYGHGARIVTDYGHGTSTSTGVLSSSGELSTSTDTSGDFGYFDTKVLRSVVVSTYSPSKLFNGAPHYAKAGTNGTVLSSARDKFISYEDRRRSDPKLTKSAIEKSRAVCGSQTAAMDKHFLGLGKNFRNGLTKPDQPPVSSGYLLSTATASSVVGIRIPDDDVLRQAAQKAEQMQNSDRSEKLERLEKLKSLNVAALSSSVSSKPATGNGWSSHVRHGDPP